MMRDRRLTPAARVEDTPRRRIGMPILILAKQSARKMTPMKQFRNKTVEEQALLPVADGESAISGCFSVRY